MIKQPSLRIYNLCFIFLSVLYFVLAVLCFCCVVFGMTIYCAFATLCSGYPYIVLLPCYVRDDYILCLCYVVSKMSIYFVFATLCLE